MLASVDEVQQCVVFGAAGEDRLHVNILRIKTIPLLACIAVVGTPLAAHAQSIVNLGTASTFAVLGASTVTSTGFTVLNGDLGTSPGTAITGFGPGVVHGTTYSAGAVTFQAQADALVAYNSIVSQRATTTTSAAAIFATTTLASGVYNAPSSLGITGTLTLDGGGNPNAMFLFQTGSTLTFAVASEVLLANGARAENVYWQVGSSATLNASSSIVGTLLANQSITAGAGVAVNGRLLALNAAVTLDNNSVSVPMSAIPEPATTSLLVGGVLGLMIGARRYWV